MAKNIEELLKKGLELENTKQLDVDGFGGTDLCIPQESFVEWKTEILLYLNEYYRKKEFTKIFTKEFSSQNNSMDEYERVIGIVKGILNSENDGVITPCKLSELELGTPMKRNK